MVIFATLGLGLIVGIVGVAFGLAVFALLTQAEDRAVVRSSLRQLEGYEVENVRDQELLKPVTERAVQPIVDRLTDIGRRFVHVGYTDRIRQKYVQAGRDPDDADRFLAARVLTIALIPVAAILIILFLPVDGLLRWAIIGFVGVLLALGPQALLARDIEERQYQLRVKLPDVLDLLVISVEAGLGFEQALDRTIAAVPGPLTAEFARMLGEVRAGSTRADAMRALDERTDVAELRSFVLAILQADTFGISIGRVLRAQADEMRVKRRQLAQEQAQKAPVKMLIPMVFCIFPALFIIVLGPAVINILDNFK